MTWAAVALADKLDSVVGMLAAGERPTGSRDPLGLRRQAQGAVKILADLAEVTGLQARVTLGQLVAQVLALGGCEVLAVSRHPERLGWLGGLGIGAVITGVWWVSGVLGYVPEDPQTLEPAFLATNSHRMEALSMASPLAYALDWLLFFSDSSKTLTLGIVSVLGVPLGAAGSAVLQRSFRWEGFANVQDLGLHLVGASLMGVGGVVAMGCTIGQGISGLSTLSLGSGLAVLGIVAGGLLGLRYQSWRIERMG